MEFSERKLSVIIAGVQKAATSSLYHYMQQHPEFTGHGETEFSYFVMDSEFGKGIQKSWDEHFPMSAGHTKYIAKSAGVIFSEAAIRRLHEHNPEVKIIIVLRNPADRAYSAFWYARKLHHEPVDNFDDAVFADPGRLQDPLSRSLCAYVKRGYYADQLEILYRYFPESSVKIILQEDLKNTAAVMKDLFRFAGVDENFQPDLQARVNKASKSKIPFLSRMMRGERGWKKLLKSFLPGGFARRLKKNVLDSISEEFTVPPMNPVTRKKLVVHFEPHNRKLEKMTGRDLSSWR